MSRVKREWVKRNEDKAHRCPRCHAIATWDKLTHGPRTRAYCPRRCNVQWRMGGRQTGKDHRWCKRMDTGAFMGKISHVRGWVRNRDHKYYPSKPWGNPK